MHPFLHVDHASVEFRTPRGPFQALSQVNFKVEQGEFVSLIGHSGCGKSTVLNLIAGLVEPSRGGAVLNGRQVDGPGPERAVVFQNHSLLPWLSAYGNVHLAVERVFAAGESREQLRLRTEAALDLVGLNSARDKRPHELSGGMKQRVGIARALAMEPKVLLLDEPFGALDALTRANLQDALMEIQLRTRSTVVMVTHDVDEAVLLSDRVVMMTNGPAATIGEVLDIPLPRPRSRLRLAEDAEYHRCCAAILRFLHQGGAQRAPASAKALHAAA